MAYPVQLEVESQAGQQTLLIPAAQTQQTLADLLRRKDLPLNTRCGQRGLCDGCTVELVAGQLVHASSGRPVEAGRQPVTVRGCEHCLGPTTNVQIHIPPRSLLAYEPDVLTDFRVNVPFALDPLWQQPDVPSSEIPPGAWGVALDVGTTTVVLLVVDLATGQIISRAAGFNRQMNLGDDVLTRINLCSTNPAMLGELQEALVHRTIDRLLRIALQRVDRAPSPIVCFTVSGNTTMLHLLAGIDPSPMGLAPFVARFLDHQTLSADSIRLHVPQPKAASSSSGADVSADTGAAAADSGDVTVHLLPGAAAYVGADLCSGILSSGLIYDDGPSLLVDIGTNGEIILKHGNRLLGCATAAGPAFEGAGLISGMRAGNGAIRRLSLSTAPFSVNVEIIQDDNGLSRHTKPHGLCGSAYIDLLAEARRIGLINRLGRFDGQSVDDAADYLVRSDEYGWALRIGHGPGKREILVSEPDLACLLQAKGAIAAGVLTLLERAGVAADKVKTLYLAGGFGMQLDVPNAIACGLLPGFDPAQVQLVGNTSLAGAYLALLDSGVVDELSRISQQMEVIELNLDPGFEARYIDQMALP